MRLGALEINVAGRGVWGVIQTVALQCAYSDIAWAVLKILFGPGASRTADRVKRPPSLERSRFPPCLQFNRYRSISGSWSDGTVATNPQHGLVETKLFWFYQTPSTPWRWGQIWFPKRRKTFTSWRGCLPEKISLNSVAAKASRHIYIYIHTTDVKNRVEPHLQDPAC